MKQRCLNPNAVSYEHYGGRGIVICEEWLSFDGFYEWALQSGYRPGLSIERVDVNLGYNPTNCTWIPAAKQTENTRRSRWLTHRGETKILKHWAQASGLEPRVLGARLARGWDLARALTTPLDLSRSHRKRHAL